MRCRLLTTAAIVAAFSLASSCVRSLESGVTIHVAPEDDKDYATVYDQHSVNYELITDFETRYVVNATNLSAAFLKSFATRFEKLFNEPQPILEEAATKAGFFVTLFAANRDMRDLADDRIWNIQLERDGKVLKPVMVKHLPQKERWRPFFKTVSPWTREYLIVFDTPQADNGAKQLVKEATTRLIFANADAKITTGW